MAGVSFAAMYVLMYAMVDTTADAFGNLNQAYMAGLMTAPMVLLELGSMRGMYGDRRRNVIAALAAVIVGAACFAALRGQSAIGDRQFLRSMIPHHSSAILMCEKAELADPEIVALCRGIVASQSAEIEKMRAWLQNDRR